MHALAFRSLVPVLVGVLLAAPAQRDSPFMEEFRKLMPLHALDQMAALVKKNQLATIWAVRDLTAAINNGSNDVLEAEVAALDRAWSKAFDSRFVGIQYDYFALRLTGPYKRTHADLVKRYGLKDKEFRAAVDKKETTALPALGLEFKGFGNAFAEVGDDYLASESFRIYAECFDETNAGANADLKVACEAWKEMLAARERVELRDDLYQYGRARFEKLEYDGYGDPSKGPAARAAAKAETDETYKPKPLGATFELAPSLEAVQRPFYAADTNYLVWPQVSLGGVDSSGKFPAMEDSPAVLRTGAAKAAVDTDGDGAGDVEIPLTGKITPIEITLGSGDAQRKWAFLSVIGQERDTYQGFAYNAAPGDQWLNLFVAPAASLVATIGGVRVQVLDDNMDGRYGSIPKGWAHPGLVEGAFQYDVDSLVIGESKVAVPWSGLTRIGTDWYDLKPDESGADLVASRADVETGTLQLDLKGAPVTWLVVRATGNRDDLYYDVVSGGAKKVEVPVGTYELVGGEVASGKKAQMLKALIVPGSSGPWIVEAGETTKMELGAPFALDFAYTQDDESVTVQGSSIHVVGRGGESYQRLWNCVLMPEVHLRKAGSSKGRKEAKLVPVGSQEELQAQGNDFAKAWFPLGEAIPKVNPGETYEVQLFEKKHKLFGALESEWK